MSRIGCIVGPELPEFCHGADSTTSDSIAEFGFFA